jgi:hypothetical protein
MLRRWLEGSGRRITGKIIVLYENYTSLYKVPQMMVIIWRSRRGRPSVQCGSTLYTIQPVRISDERERIMGKRKGKVPQSERFGRSGFSSKNTPRRYSAAD